ncbi:MAG TPA: HNH endonuclease domain-containing protein [Verrucomicrobiae bacterium]|nr:HNH endonuclease domain-containing protein [Verrucomicrobiae bacterium]
MKNIELAFDVGHSSIGWAVLRAKVQESTRSESPSVNIIGCGVVTFGADDCLASKRRDYRRQRRHARATRQRIAQMEKLLAHLKVLSAEQLNQKHQQAGGDSAPWFLAARILASNGDEKHLLDWAKLWDVLRWYAHNRGYDGNRRWSAQESEAQEQDTEKEKTAIALMHQYGAETMAETLCKALGLDPLGDKQSSKENFKRLNAAFPRPIVENEVRRLLEFHRQKHPAINDALLKSLFEDWQAAGVSGLKLPARYQGGLLFGQLVPRFDNRIISICPITGEKVPSKNCPEFLKFRWAMTLANIRVAGAKEKELRPLSASERKKINALMEDEGALTPTGLKKSVRETAGCVRDNLDTMLMHPDSKDALMLDPVQKLVRSEKLKTLWPTLSYPVKKRTRDLWQRGKLVTLERICGVAQKCGESLAGFETELNKIADSANTKRGKKEGSFNREALLKEPLTIKKSDGRAAFARALLVRAHAEVMAGKHPKEEGGCLFITEEMRQKQLQKRIDEQTNNHLVRHRLLILERLLEDLIAEPAFANGDRSRITQITIEVNRDLREMSGKSAKEIQQDLGRRLSNHHGVATKLEKDLDGKTFNGQPIQITAGLIRKARIAEDLSWTCPYTGKSYDAIDLVSRQVDKDHIIPRSLRPSDSLDSLAITFSEVNRMKGQRTAWQFVNDMQGMVVEGSPQLSIVSLTRFKQWVEGIESYKGHDDDKRRKKRRKELLLLPTYEDKGFVPRDLTVTSQLVRLGAQIIKKHFTGVEKQPVIVSLPGSVTGTVRKGWNLLGCLAVAAPQVKEADGSIKNKTDIRNVTHLHHALDACVLGLASHYLPNNGGLWEVMLKRNPNEAEKALLRTTGYFDFDSQGRFGLTELPESLKEQIRQRLAEKRVVQHIPADMSGMHVEENTRGLIANIDGRVSLRQQNRDIKTGKISVKTTEESVNKVIGLKPGKLTSQKGVRVITDNFGVAILDHAPEGEEKFAIIPWHKVWPRIQELRTRNAGKLPRIIRNGMLISIDGLAGKQAAKNCVWRVFSVKQSKKLDLGSPDRVVMEDKGVGVWREVSLETLGASRITILPNKLTTATVQTGNGKCPITSSA